jgi:hypothetical protein
MLKNWKMKTLSIKDVEAVIAVIKKGNEREETRRIILESEHFVGRRNEGRGSACGGDYDTWDSPIDDYSSRICQRNALDGKGDMGQDLPRQGASWAALTTNTA